MRFEPTWRPTMHVIGLEARTTNAREANPATAVLGGVWRRFLGENVAATIPRVIDASLIYAVYTCYASDHTGEYTFVLGCSVDAEAIAPAGLTKITLPASSYVVMTVRGAMPEAIVDGWRAVWEHFASPSQQTPPRSYSADLEVHSRAQPRQAEIYVAVK